MTPLESFNLNLAALVGFLVSYYWWLRDGKEWLKRKRAKLHGTCAGCGRAKESCACGDAA